MTSSARTLHPEDTLSHYRIVGPLGAGGMGEVYLAQDQSLERNVALKVLPADLVQNEERVRRFVLEAKSASSLSHPNIVTIYEIGKDAPQSASGGDSSPVHFISMELVTGKTLSALIHEDKTDLRTLLGYLAQAAEGLAKAHAAGIVHRDLKPGNIMVSADGFAKVLDFGLAKLTERRDTDPEATSAPTMVAQDATGAGVVLGTAGYMSPEQVQGKVVDHRSDIFSFGCILYEAATRRRPFSADSALETMHKIIHDKPAPVEELNPKCPAELRRLIRRCMAKNPEQRLQSMKDLGLELREIVDEYDSLSPSGSSSGSGSTMAAAPARPRSRAPLIVVSAVAAIAIGALAWWGMHRGGDTAQRKPVRISPQTSRGDLVNCVLSPDGRYLAYVARPTAETYTLHVRQVATGSDVEVVPASEGLLEGATFTPDGNYLLYQLRKADAMNYRRLMQVASLGGVARERAFDVDTRPTFSPDGKRIAFWRGTPQLQASALMVKELDSGKERQLALLKDPDIYGGALSWSPDGKTLACMVQHPFPAIGSILVMYDATSGTRRDFLTVPAAVLQDVDWLRDGSGLVMSGAVLADGPSNQVYLVRYPGGQRLPLTNDLLNYTGVSVSGGDEAIAAVRTSRLSNMWIADASGGEARQLTHITNPELSPYYGAAGGGDLVVFAAGQERQIQLWSMSAAGGEPHLLTNDDQFALNVLSANGVVVSERLDPKGVNHLWRVSPTDGSATQLTQGAGESVRSISPDGRFVTYAKSDATRGIWRLDLETGRDTLLSATATSGTADISPDGKWVALSDYTTDAKGLIRPVTNVVSIEGGAPVATSIDPSSAVGTTWAPDSKSACYMDRDDPHGNLFISARGGERRQLTHFDTGRVTNFAWSGDGKHLAVTREIEGVQNLWVMDADGGHATQVTRLAPGRIFGIAWLPDHRRILFGAGTVGRDAVLIRQFR